MAIRSHPQQRLRSRPDRRILATSRRGVISEPPPSLLAGLALVVAALASIPGSAHALVLCAHVKGGQPAGGVTVRQACKRRETVVDPAALGLQVAGPPGPPGADGQLRIYGNGSSGARTVTADETLEDANLQYTDFTVSAGATLTVPSGTVVRCTGAFTNEGTIVVSMGAAGAGVNIDSTASEHAYGPPGQGLASAVAGRGEYGPAGTFCAGGRPAGGLTEAEARRVLQPGFNAGGGGACGTLGGAAGGGGFTVLAAGPVVNRGTLRADGAAITPAGSGGGAGGVVVLASRERVENRGTIGADGGAGGPNGTTDGPGGGGGGGIVHVLAPVISDTGTTSAGAGAAGR